MKRISYAALALLFTASCAHHPKNQNSIQSEYHESEYHESENHLSSFYKVDPAVQKLVNKSVAYVVFPRIEKGAIGVGGAFGKGKVYQKTPAGFVLVGTSELKQLSAGLQLGAQTYSEIIFFENNKAFNKFKRGETELNAQASVVALKKGKTASTAFKRGVAIVILKEEGLMGELSVGGQKLSFKPLIHK